MISFQLRKVFKTKQAYALLLIAVLFSPFSKSEITPKEIKQLKIIEQNTLKILRDSLANPASFKLAGFKIKDKGKFFEIDYNFTSRLKKGNLAEQTFTIRVDKGNVLVGPFDKKWKTKAL